MVLRPDTLDPRVNELLTDLAVFLMHVQDTPETADDDRAVAEELEMRCTDARHGFPVTL